MSEIQQQSEIQRPAITQIRLILTGDAEMPRKFGKRVRACGGTYSEARGIGAARFVGLPYSSVGRALASELIVAYGDVDCRRRKDYGFDYYCTVIFEQAPDHAVPSPVKVQSVPRRIAGDPVQGDPMLQAETQFNAALSAWWESTGLPAARSAAARAAEHRARVRTEAPNQLALAVAAAVKQARALGVSDDQINAVLRDAGVAS